VAVGGRVLGTTAEHPFWVRGRGWVAASQLRAGDELRSPDGQWVAVEGVRDTGREEVVYNGRVAEYHTYFVGVEGWSFSAWAHNSCGPTGGLRPSLTEVPSLRDGAFSRWFNELTHAELQQVWNNPTLRATVEARLRAPGGMHEWLMVSRAPTFKQWGITAEQIAAMRTPTSQVRFTNPPGVHGGPGSTAAHNEILQIIDSSPNFATFRQRLQQWANNRLEGGANALPAGLRPD
jgi:hypothetical protein